VKVYSVHWRRLGLSALRLTLHYTAELLIRGGHLERQCGLLLQQLSTRISEQEES
jgi:hypothetical protein